jgi:hypothetical protein
MMTRIWPKHKPHFPSVLYKIIIPQNSEKISIYWEFYWVFAGFLLLFGEIGRKVKLLFVNGAG